jgi:hypothetical protein
MHKLLILIEAKRDIVEKFRSLLWVVIPPLLFFLLVTTQIGVVIIFVGVGVWAVIWALGIFGFIRSPLLASRASQNLYQEKLEILNLIRQLDVSNEFHTAEFLYTKIDGDFWVRADSRFRSEKFKNDDPDFSFHCLLKELRDEGYIEEKIFSDEGKYHSIITHNLNSYKLTSASLRKLFPLYIVTTRIAY